MPTTSTFQSCHECGVSPEEARLHVCPNCARRVCGEHAYRRSGKYFCTKQCAEWFFYADPEDQD